jgi:hypothetical protein
MGSCRNALKSFRKTIGDWLIVRSLRSKLCLPPSSETVFVQALKSIRAMKIPWLIICIGVALIAMPVFLDDSRERLTARIVSWASGGLLLGLIVDSIWERR